MRTGIPRHVVMRVLGLDSGITSLGWTLIDSEGEGSPRRGAIMDAGVRMFDAPEEKGRTGAKLKSERRRVFRCQRRVIRRRCQRMNEVRGLLARRGLPPSADSDALERPGLDPRRLRVEGLDRALAPVELAVALGRIARHHGFRSNARGARSSDAPDEATKMKKEIAATPEKLARYGTPALMLPQDESFVVNAATDVRRFRNRDGDYSRSILRADLEAETRTLFRAQARAGSPHAKPEFEEEFENVALFQHRLQAGEHLVGPRPFVPDQRRSPRRGYSIELFRLLCRLRNLTLREGPGNSPVVAERREDGPLQGARRTPPRRQISRIKRRDGAEFYWSFLISRCGPRIEARLITICCLMHH